MNLIWTIDWTENAKKQFSSIDKKIQNKIVYYLENKIATDINPRKFGKPLSRNKLGLWRYRFSEYRVICQIKDQSLIILVITIGHRKNIYKEIDNQ